MVSTTDPSRRRAFFMLPPVTTFREVLCQSHFFISCAIIFAVTFGLSYGITYNSVQDRPRLWVLFDENEIINIFLTTLFLSLAIFTFGLRMARKRILTGVQAPLAPEAYKSNIFKVGLLFSLGVTSWKKRLFFYILNCFIFPMGLVFAGLAIGCSLQKRKDEGMSVCYMHELHPYLVIDASWRSTLITMMFTMNYLASHNAAQPELIELTRQRAEASIVVVPVGGSYNSGAQYIDPNDIPTGQVVMAIPMTQNFNGAVDIQFDPELGSPHFAQQDALYAPPEENRVAVAFHDPNLNQGNEQGAHESRHFENLDNEAATVQEGHNGASIEATEKEPEDAAMFY